MFFHKLCPLLKTLQVLRSSLVHRFALYFEFAESVGFIGNTKTPKTKKREPDRFPRSGSCLMTTRNRIKCATSVVPYCPIIRQYCIFVSTFLKKIRNFLKKSTPTKSSISLYYNKIHTTTCFLYRLYPLLHRLRGRCRPNNRVRRL